MLSAVLIVAIIGIAMLAVAILTENTVVALIVIALAAVGLLLLGRDWLRERRFVEPPREPRQAHPEETPHPSELEADEFEPDVPYEESDSPVEDTADDKA